jgi:hypothetical protein
MTRLAATMALMAVLIIAAFLFAVTMLPGFDWPTFIGEVL